MLTMSDIASLSGCARSTVYAVINNKSWVTEKTRNKVLAVIKEHNWTPDKMASGLVSGSSNLIALILKDVLNPFNSLLVEGINSSLRTSGYNSLFLSTLDNHDYEVQAVSMVRSYRVEGIIMTPQQVGVDLSHIWRIKESGVPCVSFGSCPGISMSHVQVDEMVSIKKLVEYLASLGHERIAFLSGPVTSLSATQREAGYREGIMSCNIKYVPEFSAYGGATLNEGYEAAIKMLRLFINKPERPTAIVCYNDLVAAGVYRAAAELNLSIPEDLSVTGFDDIELAAVFGPPLTTIRQPCYAMGIWMAERVLKEIRLKREGALPETESHIFPGEIVVRQSTASPAK